MRLLLLSNDLDILSCARVLQFLQLVQLLVDQLHLLFVFELNLYPFFFLLHDYVVPGAAADRRSPATIHGVIKCLAHRRLRANLR